MVNLSEKCWWEAENGFQSRMYGGTELVATFLSIWEFSTSNFSLGKMINFTINTYVKHVVRRIIILKIAQIPSHQQTQQMARWFEPIGNPQIPLVNCIVEIHKLCSKPKSSRNAKQINFREWKGKANNVPRLSPNSCSDKPNYLVQIRKAFRR